MRDKGGAMSWWRIRSVRVVAVVLVLPLPSMQAAAETVDFDGSILVDCQCPAPTMAGDCAKTGRDDWDYTISLAVKNGFDIDADQACYRKRDTTVCCEQPRGSFKGSIAKECPGKSSC